MYHNLCTYICRIYEKEEMKSGFLGVVMRFSVQKRVDICNKNTCIHALILPLELRSLYRNSLIAGVPSHRSQLDMSPHQDEHVQQEHQQASQ